MPKILQPKIYFKCVLDIDYEIFSANGIIAVILDLDNTLAPWKATEFPNEIIAWIAKLKETGIRFCLVSNGRSERVANIVQAIDIPFVSGAQKPRKKAFLTAMAILGSQPENTAVIGDQIFTDVLGGNRLGLFTILVEPIDRKKEFKTTKILRIAEKILIRRKKLRNIKGARSSHGTGEK